MRYNLGAEERKGKYLEDLSSGAPDWESNTNCVTACSAFTSCKW